MAFWRQKKTWWGRLILIWTSVIWSVSAWWLVHASQSTLPMVDVKALEVRAAGPEEAVILPQETVQTHTDGFSVLVVVGQRVSRLFVRAEPWREQYYRVTGLPAHTLVILGQASVGELVSYQLVNPEAGPSGEIYR